jgi:hypothetical protein
VDRRKANGMLESFRLQYLAGSRVGAADAVGEFTNAAIVTGLVANTYYSNLKIRSAPERYSEQTTKIATDAGDPSLAQQLHGPCWQARVPSFQSMTPIPSFASPSQVIR